MAWKLQNARIGVIARTNADARGVLFFGDSGLENNIPKSCIAKITTKPLELHLVNGSVLYGYSAEEPKGLRGPNFHVSLCMAKGTKVTMGDKTEKPIEDVIPGDVVLTRRGPRKVVWSEKTGTLSSTLTIRTESGVVVSCTPNHPFYVTGRDFVRADGLRTGDQLCRLSNTLGRNGTKPTSATTCATRREETRPCYIGKYIKIFMEVLSRGITYTTWTGTEQTTPSKTWRCLVSGNITSGTTMGTDTSGQKSKEKTSRKTGWPESLNRVSAPFVRRFFSLAPENQVRGAALSVEDGPQNRESLSKSGNASIVPSLISLLRLGRSTAPKCVMLVRDVRHTGGEKERELSLDRLTVRAAHRHSPQNERTPNSVVDPVPNTITDRVDHISESSELVDVYDIQVEDAHEFFANGVLVHNCDEIAHWSGLGAELEDPFEMVQMATRLPSPFKTKIIAATTPDDVDLMFELEGDPMYTKVYGSTYDNKDNLDKTFLDKVSRKEGTLLGDMELHGKLRRRGGSNLFEPDWFRLWPAGKPWPVFEHVIQSWDTALSIQTTADFTAGTTWGVFHDKDTGPGIMLIDAFQDRLSFPALVSRIHGEYSRAKGPNGNIFINQFLIESQGSGISLIQQLEGSGLPIVPISTNAQSKFTRAAAVSYMAEKGLIWVPEGYQTGEVAEWAMDWFLQMIKFSGSPNSLKNQKDDYVDSTTGAWQYLDNLGFGRYPIDKRGRRGVSSSHQTPWKNPYLL